MSRLETKIKPVIIVVSRETEAQILLKTGRDNSQAKQSNFRCSWCESVEWTLFSVRGQGLGHVYVYMLQVTKLIVDMATGDTPFIVTACE